MAENDYIPSGNFLICSECQSIELPSGIRVRQPGRRTLDFLIGKIGEPRRTHLSKTCYLAWVEQQKMEGVEADIIRELREAGEEYTPKKCPASFIGNLTRNTYLLVKNLSQNKRP